MAEIALNHGKVAIVDDKDLLLVSARRWHAFKHGHIWYAESSNARGVYPRTFRMHRVIVDAPSGAHVDHINGNGLDNRRSNLRLCTCAENQHNQHARRGGASRFKGVSRHPKDPQRWRAYIRDRGRQLHLGFFCTEADAALAYDAAARRLWGEFAHANSSSGFQEEVI